MSATPPVAPVAIVAPALSTSVTASALIAALSLVVHAAVLVAVLIASLWAAWWYIHIWRWRRPWAVIVGRGRGWNKDTSSWELWWGRRWYTKGRHWHRKLSLKLARLRWKRRCVEWRLRRLRVWLPVVLRWHGWSRVVLITWTTLGASVMAAWSTPLRFALRSFSRLIRALTLVPSVAVVGPSSPWSRGAFAMILCHIAGP